MQEKWRGSRQKLRNKKDETRRGRVQEMQQGTWQEVCRNYSKNLGQKVCKKSSKNKAKDMEGK